MVKVWKPNMEMRIPLSILVAPLYSPDNKNSNDNKI